MSMVVRTNVMAMNSNRSLGINNSTLSKSIEKLSSGFRINRAADDASGLAISEKMKSQIKGLEQASTNSQDGISLIQTAEGATTEIHNMLNRMKELAIKSANGTIQDEVDREAIQAEVAALNEEITRITSSTTFNGIQLLDGNLSAKNATVDATFGTTSITITSESSVADAIAAGLTGPTTTFADGSAAAAGITVAFTDATGAVSITLGSQTAETYTADQITQAVRDAARAYGNGTTTNAAAVADFYSGWSMSADGPITATAGEGLELATTTLVDAANPEGGLTLQVGDTADAFNKVTVSVDNLSAAGIGTDAISLATETSSADAVDVIETAINKVSTNRANLGALQNRLEYTINNLDVTAENMSAANSRIRDTDMAEEMMAYTQSNVLTQAAQAMLAQANQQPQAILQLLQ